MRYRLPNLNQLRAFEAAARLESFKAAAQELNVTQAAISHQIKALEEALGIRLFQRGTRKVTPTKDARSFAGRLEAAFHEIAEATNGLTRRDLTGEIVLSIAPFYGNRIVLPRLANFHNAYPGLRISPQMSSALARFDTDGTDAALRYGAGEWKGLASLLLHRDTLAAVATPGYVAGRTLPLKPEEIAAMTLGYNRGWRDDWTKWFEAAGYEGSPPGIMMEYDNRARMLDLALAGHGAVLCDLVLAAAEIATGHLVQIHPATIETGRGMWVVFPETATPDPRVLGFRDWLRADLGIQDL